MDEFSDYDEGTYLLIARSINQGYLPYRDIFAVHPPLFYYLLALWLRIFGDSLIAGRLLSMFIGILSVFLGYSIGSKLGGEDTGLLLAGILTLDPFLIFYNASVYHLTLIEFSVLLTIYLWLRGTSDLITAFILGILSTVKHTLLPYALAFLLFRSSEFSEIKIDKKKVVRAFFLAYTFLLIVETLLIVAYPNQLSRNLLILPGIKKGEIIGSFLPVLLFLIFFLFTLRAFSTFSFTKIIKMVKLKVALLMLLAFILGRGLLEIPLGLMVSKYYFSMVYMANSSRYVPFLNIPNLFADILRVIREGKLELLYPYYSILILTFILLIRGGRGSSKVGALALMTALMYFIFPIQPVARFLYPILLLIIIYLASALPQNKVNIALVFSLIFILSVTMVAKVPKGELAIPFATHTKEIREESRVILENIREGYAMNPMDAYLFNIDEPRFYIDNFGILYLKGEDPKRFLESLNTSYVVLSTWVFAIMDNSPVLSAEYGEIIKYLVENGTLVYGLAYTDTEKLLVYSLARNSGISFFISSKALDVHYNGSLIFKIKPSNDTRKILVKQISSHYYLLYTSGNNSRTIYLKVIGNRIEISDPVYIEFPAPVCIIGENRIRYKDFEIGIVKGNMSRISDTLIKVRGELEITH